jgi:hypothetical protein
VVVRLTTYLPFSKLLRIPDGGKSLSIPAGFMSKELYDDLGPALKQEGLLGAYLALRGQPTATDQYLLNKSRWDMLSSIRKGKSVDNGFYKRKNLRVIRYNQLPADDKIFSAFIHQSLVIRHHGPPRGQNNPRCLSPRAASMTGVKNAATSPMTASMSPDTFSGLDFRTNARHWICF